MITFPIFPLFLYASMEQGCSSVVIFCLASSNLQLECQLQNTTKKNIFIVHSMILGLLLVSDLSVRIHNHCIVSNGTIMLVLVLFFLLFSLLFFVVCCCCCRLTCPTCIQTYALWQCSCCCKFYMLQQYQARTQYASLVSFSCSEVAYHLMYFAD